MYSFAFTRVDMHGQIVVVVAQLYAQEFLDFCMKSAEIYDYWILNTANGKQSKMNPDSLDETDWE
jgi:hypothetical protein